MAPQMPTVVAIDELRAAASQDQAIEADYAIWLVRLTALTALQTAGLLALIEVETQLLSQLEGYEEAPLLAAFNYDLPALATIAGPAVDQLANYPTMGWGVGHQRPPALASTGDPEPSPELPMPNTAIDVLDSPVGSPRGGHIPGVAGRAQHVSSSDGIRFLSDQLRYPRSTYQWPETGSDQHKWDDWFTTLDDFKVYSQ